MEERWGWAAAAAALMAPIGAALANWWNTRGAKEQREGDWREKGQQSLFTQQGVQLSACYKRVAELEAELVRIELDRDRGWDKARTLYGMLHDARHKHVNTIQAAASGKTTPDELIAREPPPVPPFNAISPMG